MEDKISRGIYLAGYAIHHTLTAAEGLELAGILSSLRRSVSDEDVREALGHIYEAGRSLCIDDRVDEGQRFLRDHATIEAALTSAAQRPAEVVEAWDRYKQSVTPDDDYVEYDGTYNYATDEAAVDRFFHGDDAS